MVHERCKNSDLTAVALSGDVALVLPDMMNV